MDNALINRYMKLLEPLTFDLKLELLSRLSESLKSSAARSVEDKEKLLDKLSGAWSDMDDGLVDEIFKSRSISERVINLD